MRGISSAILLALVAVQSLLLIPVAAARLGYAMAGVMLTTFALFLWLQAVAIRDLRGKSASSPESRSPDWASRQLAVLSVSHLYTSLALSGLLFLLR